MRGDADARRQPRGDQVEHDLQLFGQQRERLGIRGDQRLRGRVDVVHVQQRIRQGDGEFVYSAAEGHVAEIDQPRHPRSVGGVDDEVVVVGVLVQHRRGQVLQPRRYALPVASEYARDQGATFGHHVVAPRLARDDLVQVPEEPRPVRGGMAEAAHGARQPAHDIAQAGQQFGRPGHGREQPARQVRQQAHAVRGAGDGPGAHVAAVLRRDQALHAERRIDPGQMLEHRVLQVQEARVLGRVGDLEHELALRGVEQQVLVAFADQWRHDARQPVVAQQRRRDVRVRECGFGVIEHGGLRHGGSRKNARKRL